jgi:hypothetical protein
VRPAQHVWLSTLLRSVVAATSVITAAVYWLVDATDRIGLAISRMATLCRPEAVVGERKLADSPATELGTFSELLRIKKVRPLYGSHGEPSPEGPGCYAKHVLAFRPDSFQRLD